MLVSVDAAYTIGFLGFIFGLVMLICAFIIVAKLSSISKTLQSVLAHQRFANAWPVKQYGRWVVLDRTFNTETEARAFIGEYRRNAETGQGTATKAPSPAPEPPRKEGLFGKSPLHEYEQEARRREQRSL